MANYFYKGKEVRSRSDRDRDVKLSWAHTVTLKHTDINFRVMDSVASISQGSVTDLISADTLKHTLIIPYSLHKGLILSVLLHQFINFNPKICLLIHSQR